MYDKELKKFKKFVKKEWDIDIEAELQETLLQIAEKIVMTVENCDKKAAYNMYVGTSLFHYPGWVAIDLVECYYIDIKKLKGNNTLQDLFDEYNKLSIFHKSIQWFVSLFRKR